uniref:Histone-lysine N-methyltransferase n=1 Tax=Ditylenchus dipsaci TaxID=166011 RepID=A0A915CZG9_9BILA
MTLGKKRALDKLHADNRFYKAQTIKVEQPSGSSSNKVVRKSLPYHFERPVDQKPLTDFFQYYSSPSQASLEVIQIDDDDDVGAAPAVGNCRVDGFTQTDPDESNEPLSFYQNTTSENSSLVLHGDASTGMQIDPIEEEQDCLSRSSSASVLVIHDNPTKQTYEVDKILHLIETADGIRFLVKWKHYPYDLSTVESFKSMTDCEKLQIEDFYERRELQNVIAKGLHRSSMPFFYDLSQSPGFYRFHEHEDTLNRIAGSYRQAKIYIENWVDKKYENVFPRDFQFIVNNILSKEVHDAVLKSHDRFVTKNRTAAACKCDKDEGCKGSKCCPQIMGTKPAYTSDGRIRDDFPADEGIIECSTDCPCGRSCPMRLVQRGRQFPIVIFRTVKKGWSVRTAVNIPKNSFVMEYCGKVMTMKAAKSRSVRYLYNMDGVTKEKCLFVIDAFHHGNEARFANHSCDPNMKVQFVFVERFGPSYHRIAFFANRDIEKGEELTFDYYGGMEDKEYNLLCKGRGKKSCLCESENCRGYLI